LRAFVKGALGAGAPIRIPETVVQFELPPEIDFASFGEVEVRPLPKIRRLSAAHLHRSWVTVPHVTQHDEADITDLEAFRKQQREEAEKRGVNLTMLAFLMKAVVRAIKEYPQFGASLDRSGENLIVKKYYHLGIAVDTPNGLVVPVIRDVDRKSAFDLAEDLGHMSKRARSRKLRPQDLQGGCFTISSLGGIGGTAFTPVVNTPEVAILGVSRSALRPVWIDAEFVSRLMLPLSLSYDHRVIDGADAVRFTTRLCELLADVRSLVL
jgi:pyruvate dehydrogenase E2 component (dihydrolipoamide acetyltransferase)